MKHITILFIVAALLTMGCKSKPANKGTDSAGATTNAEPQPEVAEPEPEPEPEPAPPPKLLSGIDRSCEQDTDCTMTTLIGEEGPRLCCVGCEPHAVSVKWLNESIKTCTQNAQTKSIKCPPQKCEPSEFNAAHCVEGTCELHTAEPGTIGQKNGGLAPSSK